MTINETSFFRDIHPFDAMTSTIIPELIKKRGDTQTFNIWSAACSSGQELYSIAMLLRDNFPELMNWSVNLTGTDLSGEILERARNGVYTQADVKRGLNVDSVFNHLRRKDKDWQICPPLQKLTTFSKLNLISWWPVMPPMDVVFLRNVLIYFTPDTKKMILRKIRRCMAPDGVLFLGGSETTMHLDAEFTREQVKQAVFYRAR